jgi:hypothetical protein
MDNQIENSFPLFFLGVMVGVYGGWLIDFFDRLTFPSVLNFNFYVLFGLTIAALLMFAAYFITSFVSQYNSNVYWVLLVTLTLTCFLFQDAFIKHDPSALAQNSVFWVFGLIILCVILPFEWVSSGRRHRHLIETRWKKPKIGILNDMKWDTTDPQISAWTDISPEKWKTIFKSATKIGIEFVTVEDSLEKFVAVLNPYGSVYPERDLKNFSTMNKMLDFVKEGGTFINIADIPFYYAYDQKLNRKLDTTAPFFTIQNNQIVPTRPFELTPLMKELGLNIFSVNIPIQQNFSSFTKTITNIVSERVAKLEPNMQTLIPTNPMGNVELSAFFGIKYGEGDFIFSLIWLTHNHHTQQDKNVISDAIAKAAITNFEKKIDLHKKAWYEWLFL